MATAHMRNTRVFFYLIRMRYDVTAPCKQEQTNQGPGELEARAGQARDGVVCAFEHDPMIIYRKDAGHSLEGSDVGKME